MNRPDDVTGLPVLDRERWDAEADLALGARAIDLAAARAGAVAQRRSRRTRWTGLAVAATVLGLLVVALGPWGARPVSAPVPPAGSGPTGLPDRIWSPPPWTPSVTEAPIGRVAAVVTAPVTGGGWTRSSGTAPVLVSDDSQYRVLPGRDGTAVSVSADGSGVAWTPQGGGAHRTSVGDSYGRAVLRWVDVRSGRDDRKDLTVEGLPSEVLQTTWSPDGRWVGASIQYTKRTENDADVVGGALYLVQARTGQVHRVCSDCTNRIGFDAAGRVLTLPGTAVSLPAGLKSAVLPAGADGDAPTTVTQPLLLADGTAETPISLGKQDSTTFGPADDWWVNRRNSGSNQDRIPLPGRHSSVDLLTVADGAVLARVGDPVDAGADGQWIRYVVWRVPIDGPDGVTPKVSEVLRYAGPDRGQDFSVLAVSTDLAATGRQVPGTAPSLPWWQPSHLRWLLAYSWSSLAADLLVLAVILLGSYRGVQSVRRRWAARRDAAAEGGQAQM